ncbi:hypothetical protein D027_4138, partial [Vibrio parahaemolyticus 861]
PRNCKAM